jgi:hypothetical protein
MIGEIANFLGIIGVILMLAAYMLIQTNRMSSASMSYSLLNAIGSFLVLVSLFFYWNLPAGIIESAWLILSLYGLAKALMRHKERQ